MNWVLSQKWLGKSKLWLKAIHLSRFFGTRNLCSIIFNCFVLFTLCCTLKKLLELLRLMFTDQSVLIFGTFTCPVNFVHEEIVFEEFSGHCVALAFCNSRSFSRPCEIKAFVRSTHAESRIHSIKVYCALAVCTDTACWCTTKTWRLIYWLIYCGTWLHTLGFADWEAMCNLNMQT